MLGQFPTPTTSTTAPSGTTPGTTTPGGLIQGLRDINDGCTANSSWVCERVYDWTGNAWLAGASEWFVAKPLVILIIVVVAWLVAKLLRRSIRNVVYRAMKGDHRKALRRAPKAIRDTVLEQRESGLRGEARAQALTSVFSSIATALVWFVAIVVSLSVLEIDLAPLLASAGIVGFALGFGAQDVVKDFLAGMFIIMEDQFGVGDVVDLGDATGTVEAITLRTTRVRDLEGVLWHVPNGEIQRVANKSQEWARALLDVDVAYDTDLDQAIELVTEVANELSADDDWRDVILDAPEVWGVETFGADGITIRMVIKTLPAEQWKVLRQLRLRLKKALDAAGIEIPFPQRTVWVNRADDAPAPDA